MKSPEKSVRLMVSSAILFVAFFIYFFLYNRYHLWHLEQNQLFRYSSDFIIAFFDQPGGFILLAGAFFTQFFYDPWLASGIVTIIVFLLFLVTRGILKVYRFDYFIPAAIPVLLIAALQSDHNYLFAYTVGWLLIVTAFRIYIQTGNPRIRYAAGLLSFPVLFYLGGFYALLILPLYIIHELVYSKVKSGYLYCSMLLISGVLIPFVSQHSIFLTGSDSIWTIPLNDLLLTSSKLYIILFSAYLPLLLFLVLLKSIVVNRKVSIASTLVFLVISILIIKNSYDKKNELFLHIDACFQRSDYKKVLELSREYPGNNRLVIYFTNLALSQQGQLASKFLEYNQSGTNGLWLEWKRNETAPLYGMEFYDIIGYNNEAFRWSFEAMEVNGLNPRSLKKLVIASLINSHLPLAEKYLGLLHQTLHYRGWAHEYGQYIADTTKIAPEITAKKRFIINADFISTGSPPYELMKLLENHHDNRVAFEYLMTSFLLSKNLDLFASQIYRLRELGYTSIPRYFEEALILYQGVTHKNVVPPGYVISEKTIERFHNYATSFAANRFSMKKASGVLGKSFGDTFWYYMQFTAN